MIGGKDDKGDLFKRMRSIQELMNNKKGKTNAFPFDVLYQMVLSSKIIEPDIFVRNTKVFTHFLNRRIHQGRPTEI